MTKIVAIKKCALLTDEDANQIIDDVHDHVDSEYGITWTTLKCTIDEYLEDKNNG